MIGLLAKVSFHFMPLVRNTVCTCAMKNKCKHFIQSIKFTKKLRSRIRNDHSGSGLDLRHKLQVLREYVKSVNWLLSILVDLE
jgi:hypothetical protein